MGTNLPSSDLSLFMGRSLQILYNGNVKCKEGGNSYLPVIAFK